MGHAQAPYSYLPKFISPDFSIQQIAKFYFAKGSLVDNSPNFPTTKVSLHMVAGVKAEARSCLSDASSCDVSGPVETVTGLFPACAVTVHVQ